MSWHYSLVLVEAFSRAGSSDTASCARLKRMRIAERSSWSARKTAFSKAVRSGMTFEPSIVRHGVAAWISSLPDSPVSRLAPPGLDEEPTTSATCGPTPSGSSVRSDLDGSSSKTSPDLSPRDTLDRSSKTWPKQGLMLRGDVSPLPELERRTGETGSGCSGAEFPTPLVPTGGGSSRSGDRRNEIPTLYGMARRGMWPTPTAAQWKGTGKPGSKSQIYDDRTRRLRGDSRLFQDGAAGQLNPTWVEWLMGWPLGWTALTGSALSETVKSRSAPHSRFEFWLATSHREIARLSRIDA